MGKALTKSLLGFVPPSILYSILKKTASPKISPLLVKFCKAGMLIVTFMLFALGKLEIVKFLSTGLSFKIFPLLTVISSLVALKPPITVWLPVPTL